MDGTLVDTEPYWIEVEFALVAEYGGTWSMEHALNLVGNDLLVSAEYIRVHGGVDLAPEAIVERLLDGVIERIKHAVPWRPGARELLTRLRAAGIPCALVTMSYERFVDPVLAALPPGTFATVVTGDSVTVGKPHPEPYLRAAAELGVAPADCLAIEDSNTGAKSAVAAGCTVLVVPNHVPVLEGERRVFIDSLTEVEVDDLGSLFHR
jgi:HAD superfamily hydrolase (TIGR01509 family)